MKGGKISRNDIQKYILSIGYEIESTDLQIYKLIDDPYSATEPYFSADTKIMKVFLLRMDSKKNVVIDLHKDDLELPFTCKAEISAEPGDPNDWNSKINGYVMQLLDKEINKQLDSIYKKNISRLILNINLKYFLRDPIKNSYIQIIDGVNRNNSYQNEFKFTFTNFANNDNIIHDTLKYSLLSLNKLLEEINHEQNVCSYIFKINDYIYNFSDMERDSIHNLTLGYNSSTKEQFPYAIVYHKNEQNGEEVKSINDIKYTIQMSIGAKIENISKIINFLSKNEKLNSLFVIDAENDANKFINAMLLLTKYSDDKNDTFYKRYGEMSNINLCIDKMRSILFIFLYYINTFRKNLYYKKNAYVKYGYAFLFRHSLFDIFDQIKKIDNELIFYNLLVLFLDQYIELSKLEEIEPILVNAKKDLSDLIKKYNSSFLLIEDVDYDHDININYPMIKTFDTLNKKIYIDGALSQIPTILNIFTFLRDMINSETDGTRENKLSHIFVNSLLTWSTTYDIIDDILIFEYRGFTVENYEKPKSLNYYIESAEALNFKENDIDDLEIIRKGAVFSHSKKNIYIFKMDSYGFFTKYDNDSKYYIFRPTNISESDLLSFIKERSTLEQSTLEQIKSTLSIDEVRILGKDDLIKFLISQGIPQNEANLVILNGNQLLEYPENELEEDLREWGLTQTFIDKVLKIVSLLKTSSSTGGYRKSKYYLKYKKYKLKYLKLINNEN